MVYPDLESDDVRACYKTHIKPLLIKPGINKSAWDEFVACIGKNIPTADLESALRLIEPNEGMLKLAESLKLKYKVGIITNQSGRRMDLIKKDMNLGAVFDPVLVSAEIMASKNDGSTRIFDIALEVVGAKPNEVVFIDNQEKNLVVPERMGINTYLHDTEKNDIAKLCTELDRLGVTYPTSS